MKPFRVVSAFIFAMLMSITFASNVYTTKGTIFQDGHEKKHGFNVRQYDDFHDVLHPLQHEALPNKDFQRIRSKAMLLSKRGRAIVKLGVPRRTSVENRVEFKNELKKFKQALDKFTNEARQGTDVQLEASYNAVHDSFEMLAALLPGT